MGRPALISYDEVAAAADSILAKGAKPTQDAVYEALGRKGGMGTINKLFNQWKENRPRQVAEVVSELPLSITKTINDEIERRAADARSEIQVELIEVKAERVSLANELERLNDINGDLEDKITDFTTINSELNGKAEQQTGEIKTLTDSVFREQGAAESARIELAKAQIRIENEAKNLAEQQVEIIRLRELLDTETKAKIAAEQSSAVLASKLETITATVLKTEERTEQFERQNKQLEAEIKRLESETSGARAQISAQQIALDTATREMESVRITAKELKAELKEAQGEAKAAELESARLCGKVEFMEKQKAEIIKK